MSCVISFFFLRSCYHSLKIDGESTRPQRRCRQALHHQPGAPDREGLHDTTLTCRRKGKRAAVHLVLGGEGTYQYSRIELLALEQYLTSLGSRGSSGMVSKCRSRALLNVSTEQAVRSLILDGKWLKSLGPNTPLLLILMV